MQQTKQFAIISPIVGAITELLEHTIKCRSLSYFLNKAKEYARSRQIIKVDGEIVQGSYYVMEADVISEYASEVREIAPEFSFMHYEHKWLIYDGTKLYTNVSSIDKSKKLASVATITFVSGIEVYEFKTGSNSETIQIMSPSRLMAIAFLGIISEKDVVAYQNRRFNPIYYAEKRKCAPECQCECECIEIPKFRSIFNGSANCPELLDSFDAIGECLVGRTLVHNMYKCAVFKALDKTLRLAVSKTDVHGDFYRNFFKFMFIEGGVTEQMIGSPLLRAILEDKYDELKYYRHVPFDPRAKIDNCNKEQISYYQFFYGGKTGVVPDPDAGAEIKHVSLPPSVKFLSAAMRLAAAIKPDFKHVDVTNVFDSLLPSETEKNEDWVLVFARKMKALYPKLSTVSMLNIAIDGVGRSKYRLIHEIYRTVSRTYDSYEKSARLIHEILKYNASRFANCYSYSYTNETVYEISSDPNTELVRTLSIYRRLMSKEEIQEKRDFNDQLLKISKRIPTVPLSIEPFVKAFHAKDFVNKYSASFFLIIPAPNAHVVADLLDDVKTFISALVLSSENIRDNVSKIEILTNSKIVFVPECFSGEFVFEDGSEVEFSLSHTDYTWIYAKSETENYCNFETSLANLKFLDMMQINELIYGISPIHKTHKSKKHVQKRRRVI